MNRKPLHLVVRVAVGGVIVGLIAWWLWQLGSGPSPDFAWHVDGALVEDLRFSPDGKLLAVLALDDRNANSPQHAYIYRASTGELIRKIDDAAWTCAWSADGAALAVAAFDPWYVDVWDTANWTLKVRLGYMESTEHREEATIIRPQRLCFDRAGNLYLSDWIDFDGPYSPELLGFRVWQNAAHGGTKMQIIPACAISDVDLACVTIAENTRLAISAIGECPARVVTLAAKPGTRPAVLREYTLPETMNASIDLTPDGRFLVARNNTAITVMELFDDGQVLHTWPDDFPLPVVSPRMRAFAMSQSGHVAAYTTDRRVKVIHIPDGEKLLGLDFGIRPRIALSPDGGLLAVPERSRHRIRFYQVPPAGGTPGNSGNAP